MKAIYLVTSKKDLKISKAEWMGKATARQIGEQACLLDMVYDKCQKS